MNLETLFFYNFAGFHDFGHLVDGDHRYCIFFEDTTQSLDYSLNMLRFVSFTVNDSLTNLRLKNIEDIEWITIIKVFNKLICNFEN